MKSRVLHQQPDEPAAPEVTVTVTNSAPDSIPEPTLSDGELVVAAAAGAAVEASRNATAEAQQAQGAAAVAGAQAQDAATMAAAAEARAAAAEARVAALEAQIAALAVAEEGDPDGATEELEVEEAPTPTTSEAPKSRPSIFARLFLGT